MFPRIDRMLNLSPINSLCGISQLYNMSCHCYESFTDLASILISFELQLPFLAWLWLVLTIYCWYTFASIMCIWLTSLLWLYYYWWKTLVPLVNTNGQLLAVGNYATAGLFEWYGIVAFSNLFAIYLGYDIHVWSIVQALVYCRSSRLGDFCCANKELDFDLSSWFDEPFCCFLMLRMYE